MSPRVELVVFFLAVTEQPISPFATDQNVGANAANQEIIAFTSDQVVSPRAAMQLIRTGPGNHGVGSADQGVIAVEFVVAGVAEQAIMSPRVELVVFFLAITEQPIRAFATGQNVCANTADQQIIPLTGGQVVGAAATMQLVRTGPGDDRVGAANQGVIAVLQVTPRNATTISNDDRIVASTADHQVVAITNSDRIVALVAVDRIVAIANLNFVITRPAVNGIGAIARLDLVLTLPAFDEVVVIPRADHVIASATVDVVVTITGINLIIARTAVDLVITGDQKIGRVLAIAVNQVVAFATLDDIIAIAAVDGVVSAGCVNRVVAIAAPDFVFAAGGSDRVITQPPFHVGIRGRRQLQHIIGGRAKHVCRRWALQVRL